jgi:hypothetical protein
MAWLSNPGNVSGHGWAWGRAKPTYRYLCLNAPGIDVFEPYNALFDPGKGDIGTCMRKWEMFLDGPFSRFFESP